MSDPEDDPKDPNEDKDGDKKEPEEGHDDQGVTGLPAGAKQRKVKVVILPSSQEVRFADMFGFALSPTHGMVRFGVFQPETGEFVVHTQIALTPQGMVALSQSLQRNIEKFRKTKPGPPSSMN